MTRLDLRSPETYAQSCLGWARERLAAYAGPRAVAESLGEINAYPNLSGLSPPKTVLSLDDSPGLARLKALGRAAVLEGRVLWEHAAAGEGTRLGLGPKFFLKPSDLGPARAPAEAAPAPAEGPSGYPARAPAGGLCGDLAAAGAAGHFGDLAAAGSEGRIPGPSGDPAASPSLSLPSPSPSPFLADLCLGLRRLARQFYEIIALAKAEGQDPAKALARQRILVVAASSSAGRVAKAALAAFGSIVPASNWLFMAQAGFLGLSREPGGEWEFDPGSPRRLHNHGAMALQKVMDRQVFRRDPGSGEDNRLSQAEFFSLLGEFDDCVSLNVEDLDYLAKALDLETVGLAVDLGRKGYGMAMEITGNNPERPIKGGMCAFDERLGRDVVVESFRLRGVDPRDIKFLNKNFNHYPKPALAFGRLREEGLFLPAAVHEGRVYFQPVQGDLNFLVPTAFFSRQKGKAINSLKSLGDAPAALAAMRAQDREPGFREFVSSLGLSQASLGA